MTRKQLQDRMCCPPVGRADIDSYQPQHLEHLLNCKICYLSLSTSGASMIAGSLNITCLLKILLMYCVHYITTHKYSFHTQQCKIHNGKLIQVILDVMIQNYLLMKTLRNAIIFAISVWKGSQKSPNYKLYFKILQKYAGSEQFRAKTAVIDPT